MLAGQGQSLGLGVLERTVCVERLRYRGICSTGTSAGYGLVESYEAATCTGSARNESIFTQYDGSLGTTLGADACRFLIFGQHLPFDVSVV
nr:hypothetical protein GCM10017611_80190 [Rhodococcus wratislaviensis]